MILAGENKGSAFFAVGVEQFGDPGGEQVGEGFGPFSPVALFERVGFSPASSVDRPAAEFDRPETIARRNFENLHPGLGFGQDQGAVRVRFQIELRDVNVDNDVRR